MKSNIVEGGHREQKSAFKVLKGNYKSFMDESVPKKDLECTMCSGVVLNPAYPLPW